MNSACGCLCWSALWTRCNSFEGTIEIIRYNFSICIAMPFMFFRILSPINSIFQVDWYVQPVTVNAHYELRTFDWVLTIKCTYVGERIFYERRRHISRKSRFMVVFCIEVRIFTIRIFHDTFVRIWHECITIHLSRIALQCIGFSDSLLPFFQSLVRLFIPRMADTRHYSHNSHLSETNALNCSTITEQCMIFNGFFQQFNWINSIEWIQLNEFNWMKHFTNHPTSHIVPL